MALRINVSWRRDGAAASYEPAVVDETEDTPSAADAMRLCAAVRTTWGKIVRERRARTAVKK